MKDFLKEMGILLHVDLDFTFQSIDRLWKNCEREINPNFPKNNDDAMNLNDFICFDCRVKKD